MMRNLPKLLAHHWIAAVVIVCALLSAYTSSPMYGQAATPTPDVNTVPRPELLSTPTNTPFPTPTPFINERPGDDTGGEGGGGAPLPTPTAVPPVDEEDEQPADERRDDTGGETDVPADEDEQQENEIVPTLPPTGSGVVLDEPDELLGEADELLNEPEESVATPMLTTTQLLTGVVNATVLNVRRGPNTTDSIIDTVFRGDPVTVLGRNGNNTWWLICCGAGSSREGWISAAYITPSFARADAERLLTIMANATVRNTTDTPLLLEMRPNPAFAWQGQAVELELVVRNESEETFTNLRLRNDLPPTLIYLESAVANGGELVTLGTMEDGLIYAITWPEIPANGVVTATVTVQIAGDVPNGALVDNLAVVDTAEGAGALAGITFAMPPTRLPRFR